MGFLVQSIGVPDIFQVSGGGLGRIDSIECTELLVKSPDSPFKFVVHKFLCFVCGGNAVFIICVQSGQRYMSIIMSHTFSYKVHQTV